MAASADPELPRDARICLLRLSALGDVTHMLPVVHTLQRARPDWRVTWIIGRLEYQLVGDLPGVDFVVFDKRRGWRAYADLARSLSGRRFDALLQMQVALRASLAGRLVRARWRIGFDAERARDGHGLFVNRRIAPHPQAHVLDGFFDFLEAIGVHEREMRWRLPLPADARAFAARHLPAGERYLAINACTSARINNWRNWSAERYAAVATHAWQEHGLKTVLTGSPAPVEREMAADITARSKAPITDLVGRTSPKQLAAILARAAIVVAPDTGPAHIANAVGTPVIGLFATSNPERTGPYLWRDWCVTRYAEALAAETGKEPGEVRWGKRVRRADAMARITVADVTNRLDTWLRTAGSTAPTSG